ncbi:hypothetical protein JYT83_00655 [bacterium AH-315-F18]|nr:hypothetical protein [bacterium AH-315-F18]
MATIERDHAGRLILVVAKSRDEAAFHKVVTLLKRRFDAVLTGALSGTDEWHWNYLVGNEKLTVQLHSLLGVSVFADSYTRPLILDELCTALNE